VSFSTQASNVDGRVSDLDDTPRRRLSTETKASFKTTEFFAYVGAVVGVLLASQLVGTEDGHDDYFRADRAWFFVVLLTIGYMVARGFAKSGSRDFYDGR
jgi:fucose permease